MEKNRPHIKNIKLIKQLKYLCVFMIKHFVEYISIK